MFACRLSDLELRGIIENAFLPMRCNCSMAADNSMTVEIIDPQTDQVHLLTTGIAVDRLDTSRAINDLVAQLRHELHQQPQVGQRAYNFG